MFLSVPGDFRTQRTGVKQWFIDNSNNSVTALRARSCSSNRFKVCAVADNGGAGSGRISSAAVLLALLRQGSHFGVLLVVHQRNTQRPLANFCVFVLQNPKVERLRGSAAVNDRWVSVRRDAGRRLRRVHADSNVWVLFPWITLLKNNNIHGV
ncbi:unnamed protein product [Pleuronectes platessa]|uniref:Uncharacterized protein n=1 Tax=Pleuronectes platessa TaxID=8262 RepID=A0A9N7U049_PLEPL|nr:unnamed protein product [Pleuronectes platessa]